MFESRTSRSLGVASVVLALALVACAPSRSPEDQKMLADRLYQALHDAVARDSRMVTAAGPGVMRVRAANAAIEVTDSLTGERLAAAVDERVGQRSVQAFGTWSQVRAAFDACGQQFNKRLLELRGAPAAT